MVWRRRGETCDRQEPITGDDGRELGNECHLPSLKGLELVETAVRDTQLFGGDAVRRLQARDDRPASL